MSHGIQWLTCEDKSALWRKLHIGESDCADGWTDAESFIAVSRKFLDRQKVCLNGFYKVGGLLLHELCHHSPDLEDHDHDQAFYEEFHDNSDSIADFAEACHTRLPQIVKEFERKLTKTQLLDQNRDVKIEQSLTTLLRKHPTVGVRM